MTVTKKRLQAELKRLQSMFNRAHGLSLVYLPGKIRYSENCRPYVGEDDNNGYQ